MLPSAPSLFLVMLHGVSFVNTRNRGRAVTEQRFSVPIRCLEDLAKPIYLGCFVQVRSSRHVDGVEHKGQIGKVVKVAPGVRHLTLFSVKLADGSIAVYSGIEIHPQQSRRRGRLAL